MMSLISSILIDLTDFIAYIDLMNFTNSIDFVDLIDSSGLDEVINFIDLVDFIDCIRPQSLATVFVQMMKERCREHGRKSKVLEHRLANRRLIHFF